jgi:tetratricopeptide (TPR) repeat protein
MAAFDSAQRGATYVAKRKFEGALRLISQAADMGARRSAFASRLTNGFLALEEVDDFVPHDQRPHVQLQVESVVRRHRSRVVAGSEAAGLSQIAVQQRYYAYAQQELAAAIGRSPAGSLALYGLGKFHLERAAATPDAAQRQVPRAVAFFQAALQVDPANHRACNELGVLMARCGRLDVAKQLLLRSVRTCPTADAWHNLARVHHRLGESHLANLAEQEHLKAQAGGDPDPLNRRTVQWLDLADFASTQPGPHETVSPAAAPADAEAQPPAATQSARRRRPFPALWTR